ncbi:hypothetical protein AB4Y72_14910 [Arthrobacter sp. YAF34]|uniref:hypothetical protein n=1 Tax=Arthrobacter sp. YAF34 TaxID=3233083 RepID=UPI003F90391C
MDNYEEFLRRLDAAADSLKKRQDALSAVRSVVTSALDDNRHGHEEWAKRQAQVEVFLRGQGVPERSPLRELHAVATNMESVFRTRAERVDGRLAAIQKRINEISKPLHELQVSKEKLTTSRRVAEERAKLGLAVQGVAGTAEGVVTATPDSGLRDDLKTAREAVRLAEALLEVKGY